MKTLEANSIDAVVTDPPYGLSFMGKKWDYDVPSVDVWREVFRVLKPGGHVLSFGGTRTYHRMVVNIEDAGFDVRDAILWHYGSGFPKSHNVSKSIDRMLGAEREVIGTLDVGPDIRGNKYKNDSGEGMIANITSPSTPEAKQWDGWGSALKPATEIICLARKPLEKGLTLAENVLKYGTGAINIDGTRIATNEIITNHSRSSESAIIKGKYGDSKAQSTHQTTGQSQGRWPANVIFDEYDEQVYILRDSVGYDLRVVLETIYASYSEMPNLQSQYANLSESQDAKEILQQEVLLLGPENETGTDGWQAPHQRSDSTDDQNKNCSRAQKPGPQSCPLLGAIPDSGLSNDLYLRGAQSRAKEIQNDVSSHGKELLHGAPTGIGEALGPFAYADRSSSPSEWDQARQPNRKPRIARQEPSQKRTLASAQGSEKAPLLVRESDLHPLFAQYFESAGFTVRAGSAEALDAQSGLLKNGGGNSASPDIQGMFGNRKSGKTKFAGDSGGASRFFYVAKASKRERNAGLEGMPEKIGSTYDGNIDHEHGNRKIGAHPDRPTEKQANTHPTVKPIKLMEYLITLITPPNGVVLDPFAGSGSTLVAAKSLGREFIGIEMSPEYFEIAQKRIEAAL